MCYIFERRSTRETDSRSPWIKRGACYKIRLQFQILIRLIVDYTADPTRYVFIRCSAPDETFCMHTSWNSSRLAKAPPRKESKGRGKLAYALCIIRQIRIRWVSWPEGARAEIFHENRSYRSCLPLFWHPFVMQGSKYIPCLPRIRIIVLTWMRIFNV